MSVSLLRIKNLSTGYGARSHPQVVASGLTATLETGTFTALIGKNGAGKSTLLRTLAGLQPMLSGDIFLQDRPLGGYTRGDLSRVMAIVLTHKIEGEGLSVNDVVEMGRMPYTGISGRLKEEDEHLVEEALEMTDTIALRYRKMASLSDGERQRVMIAKALAQATPVILLDEPTAFLDYPSKVSLLRLLKRLAEDKGKTILVSTHDLELTFQIAERLWLLSKDGLQTGSPRDLAESGTLESFFQSDGLIFDKKQLRFHLQV